MYQMNTHQKQTPLPTQSSSSTNSNGNPDITGNTSSLPTFVSRGPQTDFETQSANPSSTQIRYYEKQQPQVRIFYILLHFYSHFLFKDRSTIDILK
jgi:hypothetical protein